MNMPDHITCNFRTFRVGDRVVFHCDGAPNRRPGTVAALLHEHGRVRVNYDDGTTGEPDVSNYRLRPEDPNA